MSDEFLKPTVSCLRFIPLFTVQHNVVQCCYFYTFSYTPVSLIKKRLPECISTIELSFRSFSSVLRTVWYFSCRTLFPNKSHVTSAVRCNKSSLRITLNRMEDFGYIRLCGLECDFYLIYELWHSYCMTEMCL